ncbi:Miro (mitochondrial Rho) protein (GTPase/ calcium ion binding) [Dorcoceras hygrometricum]|uniref:Miro (Mitochondrial Rho) protein (GTPase/ calcium ion binding) n=1 Tax=Dorcoceras hygrometricum TaxID=472368 RepID=A0A2Z7AS54_9LAMI|nr:Miro (mitochondrial Rho) protein (GTPase/ calcium ion binding) [Dorcoceras hygrometricum]
MAASFFVNAMQVDFAFVLAMEHTGMARMFQTLVDTRLEGFLAASGSVYESAVVEFFTNVKVVARKTLSVSSKIYVGRCIHQNGWFDEWVHFRTAVKIKDVSSLESLAKLEEKVLFLAETKHVFELFAHRFLISNPCVYERVVMSGRQNYVALDYTGRRGLSVSDAMSFGGYQI